MTVKELRELLAQYPDDMGVIFEQYSDYTILEPQLIYVDKAVDHGSYVMRSHRTMSDRNKAMEKDYLVFPGN